MRQVLWENEQWAVTSDGLASLAVEYFIDKARFCELWTGTSDVAAWPIQIAQKTWSDLDCFWSAYLMALDIHSPDGRDRIDVLKTWARANQERHRFQTPQAQAGGH